MSGLGGGGGVGAVGIFGFYGFFSPDLADLLSEVFEVAGIAPSSIGNDHIESALRSMRLMLNSEWLTLGMRQWMFELASHTTTPNEQQFTLPPEVLTIADAVLVRSQRATPINPISRNEYLEIPDKTQTGRPDRYFCDRQYNQVVVSYWRAAENATDVIQYWAFKNNSQPSDGPIGYQLAMPPHVQSAFHDGMAARIALKFNPGKYSLLQTIYRGSDPSKIGGSLYQAINADRESGDLRITISRRRRRR